MWRGAPHVVARGSVLAPVNHDRCRSWQRCSVGIAPPLRGGAYDRYAGHRVRTIKFFATGSRSATATALAAGAVADTGAFSFAERTRSAAQDALQFTVDRFDRVRRRPCASLGLHPAEHAV